MREEGNEDSGVLGLASLGDDDGAMCSHGYIGMMRRKMCVVSCG